MDGLAYLETDPGAWSPPPQPPLLNDLAKVSVHTSQQEALVRPPRPLGLRIADVLVRPWAYWLFHSGRLFGYAYALPVLLALRPQQTVMVLAAYGVVHRELWWQKLVHQFMGYGASRRHRLISPWKHLIRDDKRYLFCIHPHSILADGLHSVVARRVDSFAQDGKGPFPAIGRKIALCFAPVIQHVPMHQEMYRRLCCGADRKSIVKWWSTPDTDPALIPGGFAESVFANSAEKGHEYLYIKDRKGFVKICIEEGKDMVPVYSFKASWMYYNPGILRGLRARISQKIQLGLVGFFGKLGTSMPLLDDTTTVVFPPFPASEYRIDQLDEAHEAYMQHVKKYFDENKALYGMPSVELHFVGADFQDNDPVARALRRIGVLSSQTGSKPKPRLAVRSRL